MCRGTEVGKARCEGCNKELADKSFTAIRQRHVFVMPR